MQQFSILPKEIICSFWRNRDLIASLVKREVVGRYRGSFLGIAWSFLNPLLMLITYTFIFSIVFNARWGIDKEESRIDFAIILFVGLIVHGIFAECVNCAHGLILSNVNFVKKVIFPLEILPFVTFGSALFNTMISIVVLLLSQLIIKHQLPWTTVFFPFILLPLVFATLGFIWFIAALGVYIRDIGQITSILTTILLFTSAVFYPISALPQQYQVWLKLNPLAFIIGESRNSLIFNQLPDVKMWIVMLIAGVLIAWAGFAWFQKTRKGFADVL
ncbi:MAG: ABC transporter permease [Desulfobacteraceae bacterium]|nr:ABC transporter permease [Desulfobacteraceae bacterium]